MKCSNCSGPFTPYIYFYYTLGFNLCEKCQDKVKSGEIDLIKIAKDKDIEELDKQLEAFDKERKPNQLKKID